MNRRAWPPDGALFDFGDLSVHEVATDPFQKLAYLSYYNAGLRVVEFGSKGLQEVGHFTDGGGNNFSGSRLTVHPTATTTRC